jgi:hypothetical protein
MSCLGFFSDPVPKENDKDVVETFCESITKGSNNVSSIVSSFEYQCQSNCFR